MRRIIGFGHFWHFQPKPRLSAFSPLFGKKWSFQPKQTFWSKSDILTILAVLSRSDTFDRLRGWVWAKVVKTGRIIHFGTFGTFGTFWHFRVFRDFPYFRDFGRKVPFWSKSRNNRLFDTFDKMPLALVLGKGTFAKLPKLVE